MACYTNSSLLLVNLFYSRKIRFYLIVRSSIFILLRSACTWVMFGVTPSINIFSLGFAFCFHLLNDLLNHFSLFLCLNFFENLKENVCFRLKARFLNLFTTLFNPSISFFDFNFPSAPRILAVCLLAMWPSYPFLLLKYTSHLSHLKRQTLWTLRK